MITISLHEKYSIFLSRPIVVEWNTFVMFLSLIMQALCFADSTANKTSVMTSRLEASLRITLFKESTTNEPSQFVIDNIHQSRTLSFLPSGLNEI